MIRILVVDDQILVREGINILLEHTETIQIVGEAKNGREALQKIDTLQPEIVLLDIEMPDVSGLVVADKISTRFPKVKTIMLSTHEDSSYVQKATSCGAKGYLLKSVSSQELEWSIRLVSQGYSAIKSELLEQQLSQPVESDSNAASKLVSFPDLDDLIEDPDLDDLIEDKVEGNLNTADKPTPLSTSPVSSLPSKNKRNSNKSNNSKSNTKNKRNSSNTKSNSNIKNKSNSSNPINTKNKSNSNFDQQIETLLAHNQAGVQTIAYQKKRKKKRTQLLHGVSLLRFKRTVSSFEFKLLVCIILFSLGFLIFIALSS